MNDQMTIKMLRADYQNQKLKQLELERVKGQFPDYVVYVVAALICLLAYQIM